MTDHQEILGNLTFGQIGQLVEIFKSGPQAHFLANQTNFLCLVDHIGIRSLGGNHRGALGLSGLCGLNQINLTPENSFRSLTKTYSINGQI